MKNNSEITERFLQGRPLEHIPVIDFHSHLGASSEYYYIPRSNPDRISAYMDRFGLDHILTFPISVTSDPQPGNDLQTQASKQHPEKISTLALLHAGFPQDWPEILETAHRNGARGVKLISQYQGINEDDVDWSPVFEFGKDKNWVALHHWWGSAERLERWARDYPTMTFVIGHAATDFKTLIEKYDNIYQCTCACFVANYFASMTSMIKTLPIDKIIYGSDALDLDFGTGIGPIALSAIPEAAKEKILGGNALRLITKLGWSIPLTKEK